MCKRLTARVEVELGKIDYRVLSHNFPGANQRI